MDNGNNFNNNGFYNPNFNNQQQGQPVQPQFNQAPQYGQPQFNQAPQYGQQPYGQSQYNTYVQPQKTSTPGKGFAIAAMVCGIVSLVLCCVWYLSIPIAVVAVVLGIIAAKKAKQGMATAGIVTGSITLGLYIIGFSAMCIGCVACEDASNEFMEGFMEGYYDALEEEGIDVDYGFYY